MPETLTMTQAAERLQITRTTLRRLVREGVLPTMANPLDKRERLIPEEAILKLQGANARPRPRTIGAMNDPELRSDELEDFIAVHQQFHAHP